MAADKKTLLRDALKQVQSGKIDKAVENYKAAIKLDPRDASVHNTLGDLYVRQGRKKEAVDEYLEASALFEKDGFGLRSVAICQKVVNLDPQQWAVRLKLAELYAAQQLPAEARAQYLLVADHHDKRGDVSQALGIFRRIADLEPDNLAMRLKLAGMFERQKFPEKAAEEYVRAAKGYADRNEPATAVQHYARALELSPANLEARLRLAEHHGRRQEWQTVVGLLEAPAAAGELDTDLMVLYGEAVTRTARPRDAIEALEQAQEREPNSVPVNLALGRACLGAGELERGALALNRCVSVHLSENRLEEAEALLREMAEAVPDDERILRRVLEVARKRGEPAAIARAHLGLAALYESRGLASNAAGALEKYLEIMPEDESAAQRLGRLREQSPAPEAEPTAVPAIPAQEPPAVDVEAAAEAEKGIAAEEEIVLIDEGEEDLDLELIGEAAEGEREAEHENVARVGSQPESGPQAAIEPEPALEPLSALEPAMAPEPAPETLEPPAAVDPATAALPPGEDVPPIGGEEISLEESDLVLEEVVPAEPPPAEPPAPEAGATGAGFEGFLAEADFFLQQGLTEEAESLYHKLLQLAPGDARIEAQLRWIAQTRGAVPATGQPAAPEAAGPPADLRRELEARAAAPAAPPPKGLEAAGLAEIFNEFQRSVKQQLGDEDFNTHYNLGIAYKEMGLMNEAIGEFALAERSPERRMDAMSMIALCLRDMGNFDEAALKLRTGIALAAEGSDEQKGFLYDLADLHERAGRTAEARETLRRIAGIDPGYRDVAARLSAAPPPAGAPPRKKSKVSYL